ncbi:response regulator [Vibrio gigantis]|uniref:response regulator n=1 Tax=Vibrio gigantis TaxID=296199 RepID=UPI001EFA5CFA|nr:response regulator [Vibrio gigantis]ULN65432.1 response regulator [Vibrio gigantis]
MKFIIVDDNNKRASQIKELIDSEINATVCDVFSNTTSARAAMRRTSYDFLILDVVLPKLDETPNSKNGLELLRIVTTNPKLSKPRKIIGITAHIDDISEFRDEFQKCCFSIIEASNSNRLWKKLIIDAIKYDLSSSISKLKNEKDIICISVHGIRTNGDWQQSLDQLIDGHLGNVDNNIFKYGYYNAILFFLPFCRKYVINKFVNDLLNLINLNPNKEIYLFAHSFGTYIAVEGIEKALKNTVDIKLNKLVLSGSVLKSTYNFQYILSETNVTIVNDCGDNDNVLLLSEALVPNTGMAGRVGFYGLNNERFINRYFKGGHSHYFENETFMEKYWLPIFSDSTDLKIIDERDKDKSSFVIKSLLGNIASFIGNINWIIPFFLAYLYLY